MSGEFLCFHCGHRFNSKKAVNGHLYGCKVYKSKSNDESKAKAKASEPESPTNVDGSSFGGQSKSKSTASSPEVLGSRSQNREPEEGSPLPTLPQSKSRGDDLGIGRLREAVAFLSGHRRHLASGFELEFFTRVETRVAVLRRHPTSAEAEKLVELEAVVRARVGRFEDEMRETLEYEERAAHPNLAWKMVGGKRVRRPEHVRSRCGLCRKEEEDELRLVAARRKDLREMAEMARARLTSGEVLTDALRRQIEDFVRENA